MFHFFPLLRQLSIHIVQVYHRGDEKVVSLQQEIKLFTDQVELTGMSTYEKVSEGKEQAVGFKCRWLGKDGNQRCLAVEKRLENEQDPHYGHYGRCDRDS